MSQSDPSELSYDILLQVLMKYMEMMGKDSDSVTNLSKKLSPPLVTLLSSEPEVRGTD